MDARKVNEQLTVSGQIRTDDLAGIAQAGFRAIICNRPDGEEDGQPTAAEIRAAAEANGLAFHHIPTASGEFPDALIDQFRQVRRTAGGPVFAYCRTGTRCITFDALANPDERSADEIISAASDAGYDLSPLRDRIASD